MAKSDTRSHIGEGVDCGAWHAEAFGQYLINRKTSSSRIEQYLELLERFIQFMNRKSGSTVDNATSTDVKEFIAILTSEGKDTYVNLWALASFGMSVLNMEIYTATLEHVDGGEVMSNLHRKLAESEGNEIRGAIFSEINLPTLGTPSLLKAQSMRVVIERLVKLLGKDACRRLLENCLWNLPDEGYEDLKQICPLQQY